MLPKQLIVWKIAIAYLTETRFIIRVYGEEVTVERFEVGERQMLLTVATKYLKRYIILYIYQVFKFNKINNPF